MLGQNPRDILRRAADRIRDPSRWTSQAVARDAQGRIVKPHDPAAVCWDVGGAIAIECNPYGILPPFFMKLMDEVAGKYGFDSIGQFNDTYTHKRILRIMAEAEETCP
jgi:hypothetical protein